MEIYKHKGCIISVYILVDETIRRLLFSSCFNILLPFCLSETFTFSGNCFPQFFFDLELNFFGFQRFPTRSTWAIFKPWDSENKKSFFPG